MNIQERIAELGLVLPPPSAPRGSYANAVRTGNLLYVSGKAPVAQEGARPPRGRLGLEYSADEGYEFAKSAGLDMLSAVQCEMGSLDRVKRVVKIQGFINADSEFEAHPRVLDGCSDLLVQVFGTAGLHARSVFGATSLRNGLPIVIDSIFEVE